MSFPREFLSSVSQELWTTWRVIGLLSLCSPATAQHDAAVGAYLEPKHTEECQANALALSRCEAARAEHSGKYLERLIIEVGESLPFPDRLPSFRKANDSWVAFRNASCRFDAEAAAGSSGAYRYAACTHSYNKARIALLKKYLGCLKGECSNDVQLYYLVSPP